MRKKVFSENVSPMCWLYGGKEETVTHIVSACPKLVQIKFVGLSHTNKKKLENSRSDITVVEKKTGKCQATVPSCPFDTQTKRSRMRN